MAKRGLKARRPRGKESPPASVAAEFAPVSSTGPLSRWREWIAPLIAFVSLLVLYVATLAPSVVGGDCGELTASALSGGVPHPPGYPLFALLARLFNALPLGHTAAWRANLLSAVSTAAAGALVCAVVSLWTRRTAAGLVAAALFGTSSQVWLHATSAEVFGLNVMAVALAFLLWLGVERTRSRRLVWGLTFASGLAMCNHHTFVFVGAPLCLRALWVARRELGVGGTVLAIVLAFVGLAPYAYLRWASGSAAAVSWGDLTTLDGFLDHVLRRNYGTFSMGRTGKEGVFVDEGTFFPTLWHMGFLATVRLLWIGLPLALVGLSAGLKDKREGKLGWVLVAVLGCYVVGFSALSNLSTGQALYLSVLSRFFIQSDCMLAIAAGLGFAKLLQWLTRSAGARAALLRRDSVAGSVAALVFAGGVVAHAGQANQRHNTVFADFVTTAFASLPPNAIVITMGDHLTGSVFYFREIEKLRPDVIHLDRELLGIQWYAERKRRLHPDLFLPPGFYGRQGWAIKRLLDGNPGRPVVVIDRLDSWDQSWKDGYKLATNGLVHPLVPTAQFPTFETWLARDRRALGNYDVMPALRMPDGTWENALGQLVLGTQGGRAHLALVYSHDRQNDVVAGRYAIALLEDLVAKAGGYAKLGIASKPGLPPIRLGATIWKDMGIGYEILSKVDPSFLPKVAIAYEKYVEHAAADDPDLPTVRRYVAEHRAR
jgi:hypothetical protein